MSVSEQLKATSPTSSNAADSASVLPTNQQSASTSQQSQSTNQTPASQSTSVSRHPGLSEAAFKRVVGESPPSADELEKVNHSIVFLSAN